MMAGIGNPEQGMRLLLGSPLLVASTLSGWTVFDGASLKHGAVAVCIGMLATAAVCTCSLYTVHGGNTCRN